MTVWGVGMEERKSLLEMAVELDEMQRNVPTEEADLLERVLLALRKGKRAAPEDREALERMYGKYFGENGEEKETDDEEGDELDL